jgi:hydroxymethylpyrimidine/phosphomethylpyrimidine kinase
LIPIALTIAGSDPSGGAGIQADLKIFHQLQVYGTSAITLIAVQNTRGVSRVEVLDAELVAQQIEAVLSDLPPAAAKTGALGSEANIRAVWAAGLTCPLVVDPVMISSSGALLLDPDALRALTQLLLPRCRLATPNLSEAAMLAGIPVVDPPSMREAARRISDLGPQSVLVKGGHLEGDAVDVLWHDNSFLELTNTRIHSKHTHGTGCTYSAAITAFIARGLSIPDAVVRARARVQQAIATAPGLGAGNGPLNHWIENHK